MDTMKGIFCTDILLSQDDIGCLLKLYLPLWQSLNFVVQ